MCDIYSPPILRPLNAADILDAAIWLYRRNFGPFLAIIAVVYVPLGFVQIMLSYAMGQMLQTMPDNPAEFPWENFMPIIGIYSGLILLQLLAVPLAQGALSVAISKRYLNYPVTVFDAYGTIGARWISLIGTVLLIGLMAGLGMLFCFIPGIYLAIMFLLTTPIIAVEGLPGLSAMKRSWELVRGNWWRCFSIYLLLSLLVGLVSMGVAWPASSLAIIILGADRIALAQALSTSLSQIATLLAQPVLITGLVLLYYDLRVRKEGFDLHLLAQMLAKRTPSLKYDETLYAAPLPSSVTMPESAAAEAIPQALIDYVLQTYAAGWTYDQIQNELLKAGWSPLLLKIWLPHAWSLASSHENETSRGET